MANRVNVEALLTKELYLPDTTFAKTALRINSDTAAVDHTLTLKQCTLRRSQMLVGEIAREGNNIKNTKVVDNELVEGHFQEFGILAGHLGFGEALRAGSFDKPFWWTDVYSISFQTPVGLGDKVTATASIVSEDETERIISARVTRDGAIHTRARNVRLELAEEGVFEQPHLPQNAWLEVAAHFGGGALAALGEFSFDQGLYPIYLGIGKSSLPKELGLPGDKLRGLVIVTGRERLEIPDLGTLLVFTVNEIISREVRGSKEQWKFNKVQFGLMPKAGLMEAVAKR